MLNMHHFLNTTKKQTKKEFLLLISIKQNGMMNKVRFARHHQYLRDV